MNQRITWCFLFVMCFISATSRLPVTVLASYDSKENKPEFSSGPGAVDPVPPDFQEIEKSYQYSEVLLEKLIKKVGAPSPGAVIKYLEESDNCTVEVNFHEELKDQSISNQGSKIQINLTMLEAENEDFMRREIEAHPEYNLPDNLTIDEYNQMWLAHYMYYAAFLCVEHESRDGIDSQMVSMNRVGIECKVMELDNVFRITAWRDRLDLDATDLDDYHNIPFLRRYLINNPEYYIQCFPALDYGYYENQE